MESQKEEQKIIHPGTAVGDMEITVNGWHGIAKLLLVDGVGGK